MKHIFLTNTHITLYMALSIQQHLKIKKKDAIFVTTMGYESYSKEYNEIINLANHNSLKPYIRPVFYFFNLRYKLIEFHKALRGSFAFIPLVIKAYLRYKETIYSHVISKDETYKVYFGNYYFTLARFLSSSPNCKECCLMEEGTLSYNRDFWKNRSNTRELTQGRFKRYHKNKLNKLGHFLRFVFRIYSFIPGEPIRSYGIHEDSFPDNKLLSKAVIPFYDDTSLDLKHIPNNATLFFMESTLDKNFFESTSLFFEKLKAVFGSIPSKKIYLKFHIGNASYTREQTIEALEGAGKTVKIIEDSIPSEQIFLQKNNLRVYAMRSSVLFYAGIFKAGKVFTLEDVFSDLLKKRHSLSPSLRSLLETQATFLKPFSF